MCQIILMGLTNPIQSTPSNFIMLFFIALSMIFVHCFNAFVFFIMWGWFFVSPPSISGNGKL
jgi:uncharacterized phage infection (PIP) family protein YhgE